MAAAVALGWAGLAPVGPAGAAGPGVSITRDVAYAPRAATFLDIYQPNPVPATPVPAVVLIHGGGWIGGDKSGEGLVAAAVVQGGLVAFAVNYDLAAMGHPTWPGAFDDVQAAVRWVRANSATYDVDPSRIGVLGDSAGGQLAALLATAASGHNDTGAGVQAVVSWSGPMDLVGLEAAEATVVCPRKGTCLPQTLRDSLHLFMGCLPSACPEAYAAASPADRVQPGDPPMLLYNSTRELVPQVQASTMNIKLRAAGVSSRVVVLDGSQHGTDYAPRATSTSVGFLRARLLGQPDLPPAPSGLSSWWKWTGLACAAALMIALVIAVRRRRSYTWF